MNAKVIQGDCLEVMPTLDAESIDAIVTDPPYGLKFMGKHWDHGIPGTDFWRESLRVAKPGVHLLAFGGTRTFHRLTSAIEDAGWEIRDCLSWLYGCGFPKSLSASAAMDKASGQPRERIPDKCSGRMGATYAQDDWTRENRGSRLDASPLTPDAVKWNGWGTALKPAWEPIILARKPFKQTVAANVLEHGTGALNIDACRIRYEPSDEMERTARTGTQAGRKYGSDATVAMSGGELAPVNPAGRWPANVILDEEAAAMLDAASGERTAGGNLNGSEPSRPFATCYGEMDGRREWNSYADTGGASRFFYTAKAARSEREEGLEEMDVRSYPVAVIQTKGVGLDGSTIGGKQEARSRNNHPTVKPLDLMRWLVRLVTPPNGVVLDPFMGSGSTGCAAVLESKRFVGIEREAEYCEIARRRIEHHAAQGILPLEGIA